MTRDPDERTRLLLTIPSLHGGGAERQFVELVRNLSPEKYQVTVACFDSGGAREGSAYQDAIARMANVTVFHVRRASRFNVVAPLLELIRLIRERRIQVMHSFLNLASTFAVPASWVTGVPLVASAIRDGRDYGLVYSLCRRLQARGADYLVSNSRAGFDNRFSKWQDNFRVIYNGIDLNRFPSAADAASEFCRRFPAAGFDALVGMVASLSPAKDHECFLRVAAAVIAQRPRTGFVLVGDGPHRQALEALAVSLGIRDNVIFTGYCPDIDQLTGALDVACLFSNFRLHDEGLPNAVLEAMACGVPVVATLGGGTPEILRDGVEGFLVPQNDVPLATEKILQLLADAPLRQAMGQRGREFVAGTLSVTRCTSQYEELYQTLLQDRGHHSSSVRNA